MVEQWGSLEEGSIEVEVVLIDMSWWGSGGGGDHSKRGSLEVESVEWWK